MGCPQSGVASFRHDMLVAVNLRGVHLLLVVGGLGGLPMCRHGFGLAYASGRHRTRATWKNGNPFEYVTVEVDGGGVDGHGGAVKSVQFGVMANARTDVAGDGLSDCLFCDKLIGASV
jgi:hypothetical protein